VKTFQNKGKDEGALAISALVTTAVLMMPSAGVALAQSESVAEVAPIKATLTIKSPESARAGELVRITVMERHTGRPISRAGVWSIPVEKVTDDARDSEAYASLARRRGHFLGWTNQRGTVFHRFGEAGGFILVAAKDGFIPGFSKMTITPVKALAIRAPEMVRVGQPVTMQVMEQHVHLPVPRAAVFAINTSQLPSEAEDTEAYAELAKRRGYFIGLTDGRGIVSHRFREAGRYGLVAIKEGFQSGFAKISVAPLPELDAA
jgi:hypothetical protein